MRDFTIVRTPVPVYVSTEAQAVKWLGYFKERAPLLGLGADTETTGLDIIRDRIRFFSLAVPDARICAPVRLLPVFEELLEDDDIEKRMTNAKYDIHMFANAGVRVRGHVLDTVDMDFILDENRQGSHGLKECAPDYMGLRMTPFKEVFGNAGSPDSEVETMCEIHDLLELHDYEGDVVAAQKWASDILLRLERVTGPPPLLKAVRRLHLSLRADTCTLTARQVITIAEDFNVVAQHAGSHRVVSEFCALLGNPGEMAPKERKANAFIIEDARALREVTELVYADLLRRTGMPTNPVAFLREQTSDYASLDSWASHALVDVFRPLLAGLTVVTGGEEITADAVEMVTEAVEAGEEEPQLLLHHVEEQRVPFIRTLWNMERRGFKINVDATTGYAVDMQKELDKVEKDIVRETGDLQFNPNSTPQLLDTFFKQDSKGRWTDPFGDEPKKWTSGGQSGIKMPSTNKEVLEEFAGKGDTLAKLILSYRQLRKLKVDYMEGLPQWVDRLRRIHTSLKSTGARTWRLSSADPNLQNIPVRDEVWGKRIRKLFIPGLYGDCDPDWCLEHLRDVRVPDLPPETEMALVVADYKQLELCILAHYSEDETMIEAVWKKQDLHCKTVGLASEMGAAKLPRGITYEMAKAAKDWDGKGPLPMGMTRELVEMLIHKRSELKSTAFGIVYGIGEVKLGMQLGLPIHKKLNKKTGKARDICPEAAALIDAYLYDIYPGVGEFMEVTKERCREELVVYTVGGHPRRLPDIVSNDRGRSSQAERQAVNSRIQGSAADICNRAMLRCEGDRVLRKLGVRMLMQIHDELIFEVPNLPEFIEPAKKRIRELMENPFQMRVPVLIDMQVAQTWGDAK